MKAGLTWSALAGFLFAIPCGLFLLLALAGLLVGYLVRGLGTGLVQLANAAQRWIMRVMARADTFLYPPGTDPPVPGHET